MHYNLATHNTCSTYNLIFLKLSSYRLLLNGSLFLKQIRQNFSKFLSLAFLSRPMVLVLTVVVLLSISFANHALTAQTTNIIYGNAPYLTFDGGLTRVTNTKALLGISLSNGDKYTPATNNSKDNPIVLPVAGQSFADIDMLVPTDTDSIALNLLIGEPYNYWGDDDGDGQDPDGITATGSLNLSIIDRFNNPVTRNTVLTICNGPYKVKLASTNGTLSTRYGVPKGSDFNASNATYYINPKAPPEVCFAKPNLRLGTLVRVTDYRGPATMWNEKMGFITQSKNPSSYDLNFPTTGAHNLYFDLDIGGNYRELSWQPVSHGGITATMTEATNKSVRVSLKGPFAKDEQLDSSNPSSLETILNPTLPQTFELVGRDSQSGEEVVKYGFQLKQWFVNRGTESYTNKSVSSWCSDIGYRMPKVKDLTNAICQGVNTGGNICKGAVGATPSSTGNHYQRRIGAGFFSEWGDLKDYADAGFRFGYWTSDPGQASNYTEFIVYAYSGYASSGFISNGGDTRFGVCAAAPLKDD
ncbi:hypothetical protein [Gilliamella sp. W8129]|uniref:hypothetical protein n=2 Tax=unclassified Gilliamella TaxID=2685620 RepID=UPI0018EF8D5F|nr:hypothetical protein [Gilliamella sp. W8129]MBI0118716.1 hypothetical protein [Gilliamella sp. W8129]